MRLFKLFTDIHKYGCYETPCELEYDENSYYLGDNIDLSCCRPEMVETARRELELLKEKFAGRFVSGNHELEPVNHLKVGNILLTHGDYIFWPKVQADAYRSREPGMGELLRSWVNLVVGRILALRDWDISRVAKIRAARLAKKHGCDTIICGHWHPMTMKNMTFKGVRIIVLPRGRTNLYLEETKCDI